MPMRLVDVEKEPFKHSGHFYGGRRGGIIIFKEF
jgi:hypothetical protein